MTPYLPERNNSNDWIPHRNHSSQRKKPNVFQMKGKKIFLTIISTLNSISGEIILQEQKKN